MFLISVAGIYHWAGYTKNFHMYLILKLKSNFNKFLKNCYNTTLLSKKVPIPSYFFQKGLMEGKYQVTRL